MYNFYKNKNMTADFGVYYLALTKKVKHESMKRTGHSRK